MSYDMFLKIDGINGDSADDKHKQWIEVNSYSHRISQPVGGAISAQGVHTGGRADHADFSIVHRLDSATPNVALYCCTGRHIAPRRTSRCTAAPAGTSRTSASSCAARWATRRCSCSTRSRT